MIILDLHSNLYIIETYNERLQIKMHSNEFIILSNNLTVFEFVIENIKYVLIKKRRANEYN